MHGAPARVSPGSNYSSSLRQTRARVVCRVNESLTTRLTRRRGPDVRAPGTPGETRGAAGEMSAEESSLRVGSYVRIDGLSSSPQHNFKYGFITSQQGDRWLSRTTTWC